MDQRDGLVCSGITAKPDNQSSISGTNMVEQEN